MTTTEENQQQQTSPTFSPDSQIQIRLVTRDTKYSIPEVPLYVPVSLKRYGLSEIVNKLLEQKLKEEQEDENDNNEYQHIPFDFLSDDGKLLHGSLYNYLLEKIQQQEQGDDGSGKDIASVAPKLSTESILTLEYTRSILPPSYKTSYEHPDWVSSVNIFSHERYGLKAAATHDDVATGSYDGIVRLWSPKGEVLHELVAHNAAVTSVKWVPDYFKSSEGDEENDESSSLNTKRRLVSASNDNNMCIWQFDTNTTTKQSESKLVALYRGHTDPVTCIATTKTTSSSVNLVSGSADGSIKLWNSDYSKLPVYSEEDNNSSKKNLASKKRRKLAQSSLAMTKHRASLATLSSSSSSNDQQVSSVMFHPNDNSALYSAHVSHKFCTWDLETQQLVNSLQTNYSLLSMASLKALNLVALGTSARHILLIDPRDSTATTKSSSATAELEATKFSKASLVGHTNFVTGLVSCPFSDYVFASSSMDGTVRVWDVRAQQSLHVIQREASASANKLGGLNGVLDIDWTKNVGIASGGKDNQLQINSSGFIQ